MAKEICISSTPHETRLAILEDDQLAEIYYERENEYTLAGSIYNGRVTRVLPGMQSAFVDIGLERDAFLYVTDFMELEDSEETDEVEKAAASGASQPPREVRHTQEKPAARAEPRQEARPAQKPEQKQEPRPERPARDRRPAVEVVPESVDQTETAPEYASVAEHEERNLEDSGEPGARRWRGRRRRRGSRGGPAETPQQQGQAETREPAESYPEIVEVEEEEEAPAISRGLPLRRGRVPLRRHATPTTPRPPLFCPASRSPSTVADRMRKLPPPLPLLRLVRPAPSSLPH